MCPITTCTYLNSLAWLLGKGIPSRIFPFPSDCPEGCSASGLERMKTGRKRNTMSSLHPLCWGGAVHANGQQTYQSLGAGGGGVQAGLHPVRRGRAPGDRKGCMGDAGPNWSGASWLETTRRRQRLGEDSGAHTNPAQVQIPPASGGGNPVSRHQVRTQTQKSEPPEAKVPQDHQRRAPRQQCLGPLIAQPQARDLPSITLVSSCAMGYMSDTTSQGVMGPPFIRIRGH